MLESLLRVLLALAHRPSEFPESNGWAETIQVADLLEHRTPFASKVRKDVPLAWPVMLSYFPLKLILFQRISQSPNLKIFLGADSRICQTYPHMYG